MTPQDRFDKLYLTLGAVYEAIVGQPGMERLTARVHEAIRDMADVVDVGLLEVEPCGNPDCTLGPYCWGGKC